MRVSRMSLHDGEMHALDLDAGGCFAMFGFRVAAGIVLLPFMPAMWHVAWASCCALSPCSMLCMILALPCVHDVAFLVC